MSEKLRIIVAEDETDVLEDLKETITELGHTVVSAVGTGRELVDECRAQRPDLVVMDIKMPDMDGLEAAEQLRDEEPIPFIIVSAHHDSELVDRALGDMVLAYLVKPVDEATLKTSIAVATRRFREFQVLRKQGDELRQALEDRKLIERAKGIIMKRSGVDEQEAFRRLQKTAIAKSIKLVEIAKDILVAEQAIEGL